MDLAALEAEKVGIAPAASVGTAVPAAGEIELNSMTSTQRSVVGSDAAMMETTTSTATAATAAQPGLRDLAPAALLAATAATGAHVYPNVFQAGVETQYAPLVEKRAETTVFEPVRHTERAEMSGAAPMVSAGDVKHAPLVERREIKTLFQPVKQAEKNWVYVADELLQVGVRPMSQLSGTTAAEVLAGTSGYEGRRLRQVNTTGGIRGALQSLMGGSHNSEGVITEEGGVFTENYSERRVTGPTVIITVREEITVYEAVLHEEKATMEGGHRLNQPARTSLQPISAVAEVPVVTGNSMSNFDAAIAPVATEAITQHGQGLNASAAFRSGGPISSLVGGAAATTSAGHHSHATGGGITGAVKNLLGGNKHQHDNSLLQGQQHNIGTTPTALGASVPAAGYTDSSVATTTTAIPGTAAATTALPAAVTTALPAAAPSDALLTNNRNVDATNLPTTAAADNTYYPDADRNLPSNNNASGITDADISTPAHGGNVYNESGIRDADINTRTDPAAEFKPSNNSGYNDSDINTPAHVDQHTRGGPISRLVGKVADRVHAQQ